MKTSIVRTPIAMDESCESFSDTTVAEIFSTSVTGETPSGYENPKRFRSWLTNMRSAELVICPIMTVREMYDIKNVSLKTLIKIINNPTINKMFGRAAILADSVASPAAAKELKSITAVALLGPNVMYIERQKNSPIIETTMPLNIPYEIGRPATSA